MGDSDTAPDEHSPAPSDTAPPPMPAYAGMPMHMYPFPPGMLPAQPPRTKRRQVKNACTNCQKACKKCDDARPCLRCVKYGIADECVDSQRKERQKGIKRGPYKKRDGKTTSVEQQLDVPAVSQAMPLPAALAAPAPTPPIPYAPVGYPPGFFGQYPVAPGKPGEPPQVYYPQFYFAPMPAPPPGPDGEPVAYAPHQMYPATFLAPYAPHQAYMPYMVPQPVPRADGQPVPMPAHHYAPYPPPQYMPKPPSRGPEGYQHPQAMDRRDAREDGRMTNGAHGKQ